ncbi:MAG: hypothetical protein LBS86_00495 [Treponema sp.]|jgi:hypothetical protein|nr:hypothetical protein [Treponema sp.]
MHIYINEKPADIVLESEKTVGELLSGIDNWLSGSDRRISGLRINGEAVNSTAMTEAFARSLEHIDALNIIVSSWDELAIEALLNTVEDVSIYEAASFEDKPHIKSVWEASPAACFFAEHIPDVFARLKGMFSGEGLTPAEISALLDERVRELTSANTEFREMAASIIVVAKQLEDLPLDIQTGQDRKAAETMKLFTNTAEKVLRLIRILTMQGISMESVSIDNQPLSAFIEAFTALLKELLTAYENKDVVLVGDVAEYEISPRLLKLYAAIEGQL